MGSGLQGDTGSDEADLFGRYSEVSSPWRTEPIPLDSRLLRELGYEYWWRTRKGAINQQEQSKDDRHDARTLPAGANRILSYWAGAASQRESTNFI